MDGMLCCRIASTVVFTILVTASHRTPVELSGFVYQSCWFGIVSLALVHVAGYGQTMVTMRESGKLRNKTGDVWE